MDIITEVRSRVSYKGKYENWRKVAIMAILAWLVTGLWLVQSISAVHNYRAIAEGRK